MFKNINCFKPLKYGDLLWQKYKTNTSDVSVKIIK